MASSDERRRLLLADLDRIVDTLASALNRSGERFARDSALLHFNLAFEVSWKLLQTIAAHEGVDVASPRAAFGFALRIGLMQDEIGWRRILDARNDAVHLYRASLADSLYSELGGFLRLFRSLAEAIHRHAAR